MSRMPQIDRDLTSWLEDIARRLSAVERRAPSLNGTGMAVIPGDDGVTMKGVVFDAVIPGVVNQSASAITIGTGAFGDVVSVDAIVPDGCSTLLAHATGMVFVTNPNVTGGTNGAGGDILAALVNVGGTSGLTAGVSISGGNGQTSVSANVAVLLTRLNPGSTVTFKTRAQGVLQSFGANPTNQANVSATLLWLK